MYLLPNGRTSTGFTALNPKWKSVSSIEATRTCTPNGGYPPARGHRRGSLSFYRPNQAIQRGIYPGASRALSLGCDASCHPALAGVNTRRARNLGLGQISDVAAGSTLVYTFSLGALGWMLGGNNLGITSVAALISSISGTLSSQWGIGVISFTDTSGLLTVGGTITVQTTQAYGTAADIKSILDGVLENAGYAPSSSISTPVAPGSAATAAAISAAATPTQTLTSWLSLNWPYVAGGVAAWFLLQDMI